MPVRRYEVILCSPVPVVSLHYPDWENQLCLYPALRVAAPDITERSVESSSDMASINDELRVAPRLDAHPGD